MSAERLERAWNRYCKYLGEKLKDDLIALKSQNVCITVLEENLEEASYYASDVFRQYHGLRFVRQVIMLGAEKYELLHIFTDVAKNAHSVIRKGL